MKGTYRQLAGLLVAGLCAAGAAHADDTASIPGGTLYTMGNQPEGNEVFAYDRAGDGRLSLAGRFKTDGAGTGVGLGSQGALALDEDGARLFVVNAGSDDFSAFRVRGDTLELAYKVASSGDMPISVTVDDDVIYVLNAGSDSIQGFRGSANGPRPIPQSSRPLSGSDTDAAQISFSPDGGTLAITEKATDRIVLYAVDRAGHPEPAPMIVPSAGVQPFGFAFNARRQLIVSEAADGVVGKSSVSSYRLRRNGTLEVVSPSVLTDQTAACWVVTTPDGRFAYSTNTGSGTITGFRVGPGGTLHRFNDGGVTANLGAESAPIDMDVSPDGKYLYALLSGDLAISQLSIHDDGTLSVVETTTGLPAGVTGLIVR
jgi:6-phosphogluconolactonase (cycloisomerase 2 family)